MLSNMVVYYMKDERSYIKMIFISKEKLDEAKIPLKEYKNE